MALAFGGKILNTVVDAYVQLKKKAQENAAVVEPPAPTVDAASQPPSAADLYAKTMKDLLYQRAMQGGKIGLGIGGILGGGYALKQFWDRLGERDRGKSRQRRLDVVVDLPVQEKNASGPLGPSSSEMLSPSALATLLGTLGIGAGLWGARKAVRGATEWEHKKEVEDSRKEFEKALQSQFTYSKPQIDVKTASDSDRSVGELLGEELDRLYELTYGDVSLEQIKQASEPKTSLGRFFNNWFDRPSDTFNWGKSQYVNYAIPTGLLGLMAGYNQAASSGKVKALEEARRLKLRREFEETPPAVFLRPVQAKEDEEEEQAA